MYIPMWTIYVAIILSIFYFISKKKEEQFSPFRIAIYPKWHELLNDYNLISDEEAWKQLDVFYSKLSGEDNIFQYGISFTILESNNKSELIYNNNHKAFHSEVDFKEEIEGVKIKLDEFSSHFPFSPKLWVKSGYGGYKIGITTPESQKKIIMPGDDYDLVKITTIPYSLFGLPKYKLGVLKPKQVEEQLNRNGWSRDNRCSEEGCLKDPMAIDHKYFTILYNYI